MSLIISVILARILIPASSQFSCTVGPTEDKTINGAVTCGTIMIEGTLRITSNTYLTADRIEVSSTGTLIIGTSLSPVTDITIYLNHNMGYNHVTESGTSTSSGQIMSYGTTYMYGEDKTSWTLLNQDCDQCNVISVNECNNWSIGDTIIIVTTGNGATSFTELVSSADNFKSEERIISAITEETNSCSITLNSALLLYHRGTWFDGIVPTQAEVLNMDRSILITGPDPYYYDIDPIKGFQGITTRQAGGGIMQMDNVKIEKCGRVELGQYCLHFHLIGDCPECRFRGNVITKATNKGITVHGTHHSLVDNNIIYNVRGAFIYIEDGNEYENTISNNVAVCPEINNYVGLGAIAPTNPCMLDGVRNQEDSDRHEHTGIYINAPTNHIIGNHVIGMENALFINAVFGWGNPDGEATNRVCKLAMPMGITKGNVFHNNAGFGWYANSLYTTNVLTDENGYVTDFETCTLWNMNNGIDQSKHFYVEDHVEYFEDFSMGVYECGDITFKNTISALNSKGFYWKSYRRGLNSDVFCDNCTFYNNDVQMIGPGGAAQIEFKNSKVISTNNHNGINVNHHCGLYNAHGQTGGLCASHYVFNNVDFGSIEPTFYSETHDGELSNTPTSLQQTDVLIFYNGYIYFDTIQSHPTFNTNNCIIDGQWTKCMESMGIRIIRIYSPNRGDLTAITSSGSYTIPFRNLQRYMGYNVYSTQTCVGNNGIYGPQDKINDNCNHRVWPNGYTFIVKNNENIILNVPNYSGNMYDTFVTEYSDTQMAQTSITISITGDTLLSGNQCIISSLHNRKYITQYGPLIPQSGFWWDCIGGWNTQSGINEFINQIPAINWFVSGSNTVSIKGDESTVKIYTPDTTSSSSTSTTSTTTTTTTTTVNPSQCGYIPSTCIGDLNWAVNIGSKSNPEWYTDFEKITQTQLSLATQTDMVHFWYCTNQNPNNNCDGLQIPCSRSCDSTTSSTTTTAATTSTTSTTSTSTTSTTKCGYVPNSCSGDIEWAVTTGKQNYQQYYPQFETITGSKLIDANEEDISLYWVCRGENPNGRCTQLEIPCNRICKATFEEEQELDNNNNNNNGQKSNLMLIVGIVSILCVLIGFM
eukprot:408211_1